VTTAFGGILRSLANREVITPYLENAILSQEWPDSYNIRIDSSPYYGHGDGYFHPSTHPLMGERQLFYLFHPDYRDAIVRERPTLKRELTLSMGSALHGIVQTQFIMSGLVKPDMVECEYINADHHVRGRIDFIVHHPDGRIIPVEMKALACSTPILTTSGWSTMGELRDGDEVYAPDGQPTKVLRAHPIRLGRPCYEVKFRDGQSVVADEDHLWAVHDRNNGGRDRVMTTGEIAAAAWSDRYRFRVPVTDPLQTPEADLPIDPYLLGVWLGDGSSCQPEITVGDDDLSHLCHRLDALGMSYRVYKYADKAPRVYLHGIRSLFIASGLMGKGGNKYIPEQYLLASESQRRELLAGLMDSDGTVGHHQAAICMTKELLMRQVLQLVRSLGYRATWNESLARVNGKDCPVYWVKFSTSWGPSPFAMPRKKIAWEAKPKKSPQNLRLNAIVSVTEVDTVPTRCITVAHESSLYVVGRGFIPTHNTQSSFGFSKQTEIKPEWDAQLSLALDATGYDTGILLLVEAGFPYGIKEFTVPRNDALLSEIYAKFARVREAIALDQIPNYCCPKGSTVMQNCKARFACWLKDDEEAGV